MTYWDLVLREVLTKSQPTTIFQFTHGNTSRKPQKLKSKRSKKKIKKSYPVGTLNKAVFTAREAQCMVLLLKGKTIAKVAEILKLSARTVEFYLKKMKEKIGCNSKSELIGIIAESDFMDNIDF